jgi:peptidyl-prolyl cis-trans isomerase B (cyclophilin B)
VTSNRDRQRAAARARLEREMTERAEAARRRRRLQTMIGAGVAVLLVIGAVIWIVAATGGSKKKAAAPSPSASAGPGPCRWQPRVDPSASPKPSPPAGMKDVGTPPASGEPRTGKEIMTITTSLGTIKVEMDLTKTPCTAASFSYLAGKKFFDGTKCHRLVPAIGALQCGDPSGEGAGGPAYQFGDENLPTGRRPAYPEGAVAMANGGAGTNGSQFFFLYKDSDLQADYTLFGKVVEGLDIIKKVAAAGDDGVYEPNPGGGHPKTPLVFTTVTVSAPSQS